MIAYFSLLLPWVQIGLSALMVGLILLQRSESGLGGTFGDSGNSAVYTRRGVEKILFNATIVVSVLFALSSLLALIVK